MKYFVYLLLLCYGFFYHISSSEFWTVTISKTWLNPANFEFSLLQKPLFGMFLSLFHLLPLDDVGHLYFVKLIFSIIGIASVVYYLNAVLMIAKIKPPESVKALLLVVLLILSPVLLHNFFRIRTDQVSLLVFSLGLLFSQKKYYLRSLICWALLPLISIKGFIFLIPAGFIMYPDLRVVLKRLSKIQKIYLWLFSLSIFVWLIGLNIKSITYLFETFGSIEFPNVFLRNYLFNECLLIIGSTAVAISVIWKNDTELKPFAYASVACTFLIISMPQSYPYYIASLAPIVYLPLLVKILKSHRLSNLARIKAVSLTGVQVLFLVASFFYLKPSLYISNFDQLTYISNVSRIIDKHNLNYVDGTGILPRQNFIPCYISPDDEISNFICRRYLIEKTSDIVIATSRLNYFGSDLYNSIEKDYSQVIPGLWIKNNFRSLIANYQTDLKDPLAAVFLFGFE